MENGDSHLSKLAMKGGDNVSKGLKQNAAKMEGKIMKSKVL